MHNVSQWPNLQTLWWVARGSRKPARSSEFEEGDEKYVAVRRSAAGSKSRSGSGTPRNYKRSNVGTLHVDRVRWDIDASARQMAATFHQLRWGRWRDRTVVACPQKKTLNLRRSWEEMDRSMTELRSVICHMGSHSVTCHPTQVSAPALTPAMQAGTRFTYPGGMEGWVDLVARKSRRRESNPRPLGPESNALTTEPPSNMWRCVEEFDWRHRAVCYLLAGEVGLCVLSFLRQYDREDCVRSAACLVHISSSHCPVYNTPHIDVTQTTICLIILASRWSSTVRMVHET